VLQHVTTQYEVEPSGERRQSTIQIRLHQFPLWGEIWTGVPLDAHNQISPSRQDSAEVPLAAPEV
jgi:hypothetical protein